MNINIFNGLNSEKIQGLNFIMNTQLSSRQKVLSGNDSQLLPNKSFNGLLDQKGNGISPSPLSMSKKIETSQSNSEAASKTVGERDKELTESNQMSSDKSQLSHAVSSSEQQKKQNTSKNASDATDKQKSTDAEVSLKEKLMNQRYMEQVNVEEKTRDNSSKTALGSDKKFSDKDEKDIGLDIEGGDAQEVLVAIQEKSEPVEETVGDIHKEKSHISETEKVDDEQSLLSDTEIHALSLHKQETGEQESILQDSTAVKKKTGDKRNFDNKMENLVSSKKVSDEKKEVQVKYTALDDLQLKKKNHNTSQSNQDRHAESKVLEDDTAPQLDLQRQDNAIINQKTFSSMIQEKTSSKVVNQVYGFMKSAGNHELVQQARLILQGNKKGEIKIMLHPKEFGEVKLSFNLDDNKIVGRIVVASEVAKEALQKNMDNLERQFNHEGYEVGGFFVSVDSNTSEKNNEEKESSKNQKIATINLKQISDDILLKKYIGTKSDVIDFVA